MKVPLLLNYFLEERKDDQIHLTLPFFFRITGDPGINWGSAAADCHQVKVSPIMPVKLLKKDLDFLETPLFSGILLGQTLTFMTMMRISFTWTYLEGSPPPPSM